MSVYGTCETWGTDPWSSASTPFADSAARRRDSQVDRKPAAYPQAVWDQEIRGAVETMLRQSALYPSSSSIVLTASASSISVTTAATWCRQLT